MRATLFAVALLAGFASVSEAKGSSSCHLEGGLVTLPGVHRNGHGPAFIMGIELEIGAACELAEYFELFFAFGGGVEVPHIAGGPTATLGWLIPFRDKFGLGVSATGFMTFVGRNFEDGGIYAGPLFTAQFAKHVGVAVGPQFRWAHEHQTGDDDWGGLLLIQLIVN